MSQEWLRQSDSEKKKHRMVQGFKTKIDQNACDAFLLFVCALLVILRIKRQGEAGLEVKDHSMF